MSHISITSKLVVTFCFVLSVNLAFSQDNVGIGTNTPDASALLEMQSTDKGILIPRVTDSTLINAPATGLLVYFTSNNRFWYFDGTAWKQVGNSADNWATTGNGGTSDATHFIGTSDSEDLVFKTNGFEQMRIEATGNVGIGASNPASQLEVNGGNIYINDNAVNRGLIMKDETGGCWRLQVNSAGTLVGPTSITCP